MQEFADYLDVDIRDVLESLMRRQQPASKMARLSKPLWRSLAIEFDWYPADTDEEYAILTQEESEEQKEEEDEAASPVLSSSGTSSVPNQAAAKSDSSPKPALSPNSHIERAKKEALDLFSVYGKKKPQQNEENPFNTILHQLDEFKGSRNLSEHPKNRDDGSKAEEAQADPKLIVIKPPIMISELASKLGLKPFKITADLIKIGVFPGPNQPLEPEVAARICEIHGYRLDPWDTHMRSFSYPA